MPPSPCKKVTSCFKLSTGKIRTPSTQAASAAFSRGTKNTSSPISRAEMTMGKTPFTPRTSPLRASSPRYTARVRGACFSTPSADSSARAMGRS